MLYYRGRKMRQDDLLKGQLAIVGWREAAEYGGYLPALMVMGCIMNRVRQGWGSHLEVIERLPSFHAENQLRNFDKFPSIWDRHFVRILQETDSVFDSSAKDLSNGALYWCDLRKIERDWFKEKIIRSPKDHPRVSDSASLTFFK